MNYKEWLVWLLPHEQQGVVGMVTATRTTRSGWYGWFGWAAGGAARSRGAHARKRSRNYLDNKGQLETARVIKTAGAVEVVALQQGARMMEQLGWFGRLC